MPTPTYVQLQAVLGRRVGPGVALADVPQAVLYAVRMLGVTPQSNTAVSTADLASVADSDVNQLLDLAVWYLLTQISLNADEDDLRRAGILQDVTKFREGIDRSLDRWTRFMNGAYNLGVSTLQAGVIQLDFAAQHDNPVNAMPS